MSEKDESERTDMVFEHEDIIQEEGFNRSGGPGTKNRRRSTLWNNFTIINKEKSIAECDICGRRLSYKSSISNLTKHLTRKHKANASERHFRPATFKVKKEFSSERIQSHTGSGLKRKTLTELGGLDGLILNVVADEGEHPLLDGEGHEANETDENVVYSTQEDIHDYCNVNGEENQVHRDGETRMGSSSQSRKNIQITKLSYSDSGDKRKRSQIMDLQLECLEIKKYTMQMEALVLERQLNLPRSIFTETLTEADTRTRGTQTDIGGNNTKVFYVSDSGALNKSTSQHFFTFQAALNDESV